MQFLRIDKGNSAAYQFIKFPNAGGRNLTVSNEINCMDKMTGPKRAVST